MHEGCGMTATLLGIASVLVVVGVMFVWMWWSGRSRNE
jgi:hypothetical protein